MAKSSEANPLTSWPEGASSPGEALIRESVSSEPPAGRSTTKSALARVETAPTPAEPPTRIGLGVVDPPTRIGPAAIAAAPAGADEGVEETRPGNRVVPPTVAAFAPPSRAAEGPSAERDRGDAGFAGGGGAGGPAALAQALSAASAAGACGGGDLPGGRGAPGAAEALRRRAGSPRPGAGAPYGGRAWVKLRLGKEVETCAESEWRTREIRAHVYAQHVPELPSQQRRKDSATRAETRLIRSR